MSCLDTSPESLVDEVKKGHEWVQSHLTAWKKQKQLRGGTAHYGSQSEAMLWNYIHDWLALVGPQLVFQNPAVSLGTRAGVGQVFADEDEALEAFLNSWVLRNKFSRWMLDGPVTDMQFTMGVSRACLAPGPKRWKYNERGERTVKEETLVPELEQVCLDRYFEDPLATCREEVKFQGHIWLRTLKDIEQEARDHPELGWNLEAVREAVIKGDEEWGRPQDASRYREWVKGCTVLVKDADPDGEGVKKVGDGPWPGGVVYTLPIGGGQDVTGNPAGPRYLRPPEAWHGHPSGPYTVWGCYRVPDDPIPIGPIGASWDQLCELEEHARASSRGNVEYKNIVAVVNGDPQAVDDIKAAEHGAVVAINGPEGMQVVNLQMGGATDYQLAVMELLDQRAQRALGITDAQQGYTSGRATATEHAVADQASGARIGGIGQGVKEGAVDALHKIAWWGWHRNDVAMAYPPEVLDALGVKPQVAMGDGGPLTDRYGRALVVRPEMVFWGQGKEREDDERPYEDLVLDIQPYSMQQASQQQRLEQGVQMTNAALQIGAAMAQMPWVRWDQLNSDIGERWNLPDFARYFDAEMAAAMMGTEPAQERPGAAEPRLVPEGGAGKPRITIQGGGGGAQRTPAPKPGAGGGPAMKSVGGP